MSTPEAVAWLRQQIEGDKAAAEAAHRTGEGHWWRCTTSDVHGTNRPVGALYGGQPAYDADGEVCWGGSVVVYDEGSPTDEQFAHIALHDPQNAIADCEMKLAWLAEHSGVHRCDWGDLCMPEGIGPWPCQDARRLATAYRRREGYAETWGTE